MNPYIVAVRSLIAVVVVVWLHVMIIAGFLWWSGPTRPRLNARGDSAKGVAVPRKCESDVRVIYRREKANKLLDLWDEWKLVELRERPWQYFRGNCATFGWRQGVRSNICLLSPLLNKVLNWRYRNMRLHIRGLPDDRP